jgi:hypothetical protein
MKISSTAIQHLLTEMQWTLLTTTYMEYLGLGKAQGGHTWKKILFSIRNTFIQLDNFAHN